MAMELNEGVDETRIIQNEQPKYEGFVGKYIKRPWKSIKSGVGKFGSWVWKNKVPILKTVGAAVQTAGAATANPALAGAGAGIYSLASGIEEGEGKKALEKAIAERQPNPFGNQSTIYSDMPRIHYSRKPAAYKIYQNPMPPHKKYVVEVERKEARLKQQKKYRTKKKQKK